MVFKNLVIQNGYNINRGGGVYNSSSSSPNLINWNFCGNTSTSGNKNIDGDAIDGSSSGNHLLRNGNTGDVNFDRAIHSGDLGDLLALWGASSVLNADMNQDGKVNGADRSDILGTSAAPATLRRHREQEASLSGWKISVRLGLILSR
ncbi:MAG: hypothetical protein OSA40_00815 [Phycisphaerales bacterium]|nr:hypothetical protein [Phycisphaerales bacterium]